MKNFIYTSISEYPKKVIDISTLLSKAEREFLSEGFDIKGGYRVFANIVNDFCDKGYLSPVKASKTNGRNPSLYNKYKINLIDNTKKASEELIYELHSLHPRLDKEYYFKNPDIYKEDRPLVILLSQYLLDNQANKSLTSRCTMNERSFEIFNDEKFLESKGKALLKRVGFSLEDLNCYKTLEAFFYILFDPKAVLNILIIENKDTFYSILKYLERKPDKQLYGTTIDLLIYGEGKKIVNSFRFINEVTMGASIDKVYYFGDLDFEGIGIFNSLASKYGNHLIVPHENLYKKLVGAAKNPPLLRTNQSEVHMELFLKYFDEETRHSILEILYNGKYIPQEAVNFGREKYF